MVLVGKTVGKTEVFHKYVPKGTTWQRSIMYLCYESVSGISWLVKSVGALY